MQPEAKIVESELSPSFSCYSSETSTSKALAKAIHEEEQAAPFQEIEDVETEDFEFSVVVNDQNIKMKQIGSLDWTVFPLFNRHLLLNDEVYVDRENKPKDDQIDDSYTITGALGNLFVEDPEESTSCSSSEVDELENLPSGTFCVWRPKSDGGSSPATLEKVKKSSSTGSGSKRWRIRYLLRRSNSEGKEPMTALGSKKVENRKERRSSGEASKVVGRWKAETPIHEQFYVQRRAENEVGKRKSYLPYRKDLVGLFGNVNGIGKMLPF